MLISNFGSLKAELARYMFHQRFQPDYDTATQHFESMANRRLRVRPMETSAVFTTQDGWIELPMDYLLWRYVEWAGSGRPATQLDYIHPAYYDTTNLSGTPQVFTIEDGFIGILPKNDSHDAYLMGYYRKIPTLTGTDDNATNWLISEHPDLYLQGCLYELFVLGRNGDLAQAHKALRDEKLAELIQVSALTTGATSSLVRGEGAEYF